MGTPVDRGLGLPALSVVGDAALKELEMASRRGGVPQLSVIPPALGSLIGVRRRSTGDSPKKLLSELVNEFALNAPSRFRQSLSSVLIMQLNLADASEDLGSRQRAFRVPDDIGDEWNCLTTSSSRFRSLIVRSALVEFIHWVESRPLAEAGDMSVRTDFAGTIRDTTRKAIARQGLDDTGWSEAISGQYFLVLTSRRLGYQSRVDYVALINRFLEAFSYRADDTLDLNDNHILVTPSELASIQECMRAEDQNGSPFSRVEKTRWNNVPILALHKNYLYGLALGISAERSSNVLEMVANVSMQRLFDETIHPQIDPDGGWIPYRIPWLTARILLSLAEVHDVSESISLTQRDEIQRAVVSIEDRLDLATCRWRSGVGEWVSEIESTALCLEALVSWRTVARRELIDAVAQRLAVESPAWLAVPGFDCEVRANETLASVIACSVLLRGGPGNLELFDIEPEIRENLERYMLRVLQIATTEGSIQARQYCTIPQVLYYALQAGGNLD